MMHLRRSPPQQHQPRQPDLAEAKGIKRDSVMMKRTKTARYQRRKKTKKTYVPFHSSLPPTHSTNNQSNISKTIQDFGTYDEDYNREASRFLDDEIGADVPVQIERRDKVLEGMKIEDLCPGMQLSVSPIACTSEKYSSIMHTVGRTGIVTSLDLNNMKVKLRFTNSETASKHSFWFYFYDLEKPENMWQDPCMDILSSGGDSKKKRKKTLEDRLPNIRNALAFVCNALLVLRVRRSVLSLISKWSSLDITLLGGSSYVIDLLKLAASEHLSSKAKSRGAGNVSTGEVGEAAVPSAGGVGSVAVVERVDVLSSFKAKLSALLKAEEGMDSKALPSLELPEYAKAKKPASDEPLKDSSSTSQSETTTGLSTVRTSFSSITKLLTEECILHFVQAVSVPPPVIVEESAHNYEPNQDIRKR